jgi:hypothetical protein
VAMPVTCRAYRCRLPSGSGHDLNRGRSRSTAEFGGDTSLSVDGKDISGAYMTGDDNVSGCPASEPCSCRINSCQVTDSSSGRTIVEACGKGQLGGDFVISIAVTTLDTGRSRRRARARMSSRTSIGSWAKRRSVQS